MIDSHTHIGGYKISSPKIYGWLNISHLDLEKYMKDYNINKVWLLSHPNVIPNYDLEDDKTILDVCKDNENFVPFCSPSRGSVISYMVKQGCRGIGEIKVEKSIDGYKLMDIYRVAGDFGLPVVIHSTDKFCVGDRKSFDNVFSSYPKTNFVMHGWGWWNLFGVDMEYYLDKYHNVFMDISANSGYKTLSKFLVYNIKEFLKKYSDRVLFGTDFPMLTTYDGTQFGVNNQHKLLIELFYLPQTCLDNIFFKNAEKLIK